MKQPVRGGLKGGRRSVKRGQCVEFADYRDYALGDDLRQLDWNVYARLERCSSSCSSRRRTSTITFLLDASPSMAYGRPEKLLFAKRAAAALGYIALAGEDRVVLSGADRPDRAAPDAACAARAASSGSSATCRRSSPPRARPTSSRPHATPAPCCPAGASSCSSPTCSTRAPTASSASSPRPARS